MLGPKFEKQGVITILMVPWNKWSSSKNYRKYSLLYKWTIEEPMEHKHVFSHVNPLEQCQCKMWITIKSIDESFSYKKCRWVTFKNIIPNLSTSSKCSTIWALEIVEVFELIGEVNLFFIASLKDTSFENEGILMPTTPPYNPNTKIRVEYLSVL